LFLESDKLQETLIGSLRRVASVVIVCLTFCFFVVAYPQKPTEQADPTSEGVALYERGDTEGAIKALREALKKSKGDAKAWHYLGLAFVRQGNLKEAREALGKAIDLRASTIKLEFSRNEGEWRDDRLMSLKALLGDQVESQTKLQEILTDQQALGKGQLALERSRVLAHCVEENSKVVDGHTVLSKSDMKMERVRVLFKQEPAYPESARRDNVGGSVILKAIFAADASVQYIEPILSADRRLTEEALMAARLIRFRPETICGKPVSSPIQLEYSFNLGIR
jgi:tetratricopeptide (TPR) repeat protein